MFILQFAVIIYSIILHEVAHGWVADYLGDPTARLTGRLSLNPLPHIDPLMTVALPLLLIFTGSPLVFGAAKPVPVDPFNFREPQKDMGLTALAGPATNLLIAGAAALILRFTLSPILFSLLSYAVQINVFLAVFNLLPIPPLDGFKVLSGVLPRDVADSLRGFDNQGFFILFILLFFFPGVIDTFLMPIARLLLSFLLPA